MIPHTIWSKVGGVGKTTLSVNLAAAHAKRGQQVLGIDMDPQEGGLTHNFGAGENRADANVNNLVRHMVEQNLTRSLPRWNSTEIVNCGW
ncbi:ParA family protein [Haladaptatus cibarius]|uniref:ParA family protein n=1 Tax=Haladaptatus cibarius TaxID=453847 RepID=UPI000678A542|nr:AAA family ATPase [Haladaptatus cibarius]